MKRLLFLLMAAMLVLTACGNGENPEEETQKAEGSKKQEEKKKDEPKTELSETKVSFTNFTIEIKKAQLKDGKLLLDTLYTNDSFPGEKSFMAAASLDVKQTGELLEEVSGVMSDPKSNYFYKNAVGIWAPTEFEYELVSEADDIEITIVPTDWDEESKTITVTINE